MNLDCTIKQITWHASFWHASFAQVRVLHLEAVTDVDAFSVVQQANGLQPSPAPPAPAAQACSAPNAVVIHGPPSHMSALCDWTCSWPCR